MTITISIDGDNKEAVSALLYEYYKKQGYKVRLCRSPNCKQVHELKRFFNLCEHEQALLNAFDASLQYYKHDDSKYDLVIWQGSIISDYLLLDVPDLFVKQVNRFTPKMDCYFYINSNENSIVHDDLPYIKNLTIINGLIDINLQYKTIINQLNESYPHCKWCDHIYKKDRHHYNYCSKTCSRLSREKQNREYVRTYYKKHGRKTSSSGYNDRLGSRALLTQHPQNDFQKEHQAIKNEKKRLRI